MPLPGVEVIAEAHFWAGSLVPGGSPPTLPQLELGAGKSVLPLPRVAEVAGEHFLPGSWGPGGHCGKVPQLAPSVLCLAQGVTLVSQDPQMVV